MKQIVVTNDLLARVFLDKTQTSKIVENFLLRSLVGGLQFVSLLQCSDLLQRQGISLDGCRSMDAPCPRVPLQCRNPGKFSRSTLNPIPQCRHELNKVEQQQTDRKLRFVCHFMSQA